MQQLSITRSYDPQPSSAPISSGASSDALYGRGSDAGTGQVSFADTLAAETKAAVASQAAGAPTANRPSDGQAPATPDGPSTADAGADGSPSRPTATGRARHVGVPGQTAIATAEAGGQTVRSIASETPAPPATAGVPPVPALASAASPVQAQQNGTAEAAGVAAGEYLVIAHATVGTAATTAPADKPQRARQSGKDSDPGAAAGDADTAGNDPAIPSQTADQTQVPTQALAASQAGRVAFEAGATITAKADTKASAADAVLAHGITAAAEAAAQTGTTQTNAVLMGACEGSADQLRLTHVPAGTSGVAGQTPAASGAGIAAVPVGADGRIVAPDSAHTKADRNSGVPASGQVRSTQPGAARPEAGDATVTSLEIKALLSLPTALPSPDLGPPAPPSGSTGTSTMTPAPTETAHTAAQVTQAVVRLATTAFGSSMTLQLSPQHLGRLDIQIDRTTDGATHVSLTVERSETMTLLQRDQGQLNEALDRAGVPGSGRVISYHVAAAPNPATLATATSDQAAAGGTPWQNPSGQSLGQQPAGSFTQAGQAGSAAGGSDFGAALDRRGSGAGGMGDNPQNLRAQRTQPDAGASELVASNTQSATSSWRFGLNITA